MENNLILQVGVKILLQNQKNKYLLLRRSLEKYPEIQGRWDIVGGRINTGQTFENRTFPRTTWPNNADDLTSLNIKRNVLDCCEGLSVIVVYFCQVFYLKHIIVTCT